MGKHTASPCSACHTTAHPLLDLRVAKQACADCHQNPHGDQFAAEMAKGGCGHCHEPAGWNLPKIDHSTWPLTGAHASTACNSCHHPTAEDRKAGHGASYRGVPRQCSGCHDDAHLGQFRLTQPALECDKCHATGSFKIPSFDHAKMTGWALTGAHAKTECAKCHATADLGGGHTTVRWRGPSRECTFCHANPHEQRAPRTAAAGPGGGAALAQAGAAAPAAHKSFTAAVSCSACHSTTAWKSKDAAGGNVKFDHSTTGFPLTGQHMNASCVSCHNSTVQLKRACVSCHEDFHRGRLAQTCDNCHVPAGWKVTRPLQIHRMTQFPLTGMHVLADCTQCHLRASEQKFTDAPVECYGCHQQDYQRPGIFPHTGSADHGAAPARLHAVPPGDRLGARERPRRARDDDEPAADAGGGAAGARSPVPDQLRLAPPRRVQRLPYVAVGAALDPLRRVPHARSRAPHAAAQAAHGDGRRVLHVVPPRRGAAMRRLRVAWLAGALSLVASTAHAQARRPRPPKPPPAAKPPAPAPQTLGAKGVEVTVVDVAGSRAYLQPGAQGSVRRNATVTLKGKDYRVTQASASYAVIEIGDDPVHEKDKGRASVVAEEEEKAPELPPPKPLSTWEHAWTAQPAPAAAQEPRYVPIGAAERDRRYDVTLSLAGGGIVPLGSQPGSALAFGELRARVHAEPFAAPAAIDFDGSLQQWASSDLSSRVGGTTRSVVVVRELLASYGSGGWFAGLGRMKYAASTLGTLDGARMEAPLGAGFSVGAFGGFLPNPLGGEASLTAQRFGVEARYHRPDLDLRPEAALVANGSTFGGALDERRVSGMFGVYPGASRFGGHFEVSAFDANNPWGASPVEVTAAGLDQSIRIGAFELGSRFDLAAAGALAVARLVPSHLVVLPHRARRGRRLHPRRALRRQEHDARPRLAHRRPHAGQRPGHGGRHRDGGRAEDGGRAAHAGRLRDGPRRPHREGPPHRGLRATTPPATTSTCSAAPSGPA